MAVASDLEYALEEACSLIRERGSLSEDELTTLGYGAELEALRRDPRDLFYDSSQRRFLVPDRRDSFEIPNRELAAPGYFSAQQQEGS
jgi:hypothetical protein